MKSHLYSRIFPTTMATTSSCCSWSSQNLSHHIEIYHGIRSNWNVFGIIFIQYHVNTIFFIFYIVRHLSKCYRSTTAAQGHYNTGKVHGLGREISWSQRPSTALLPKSVIWSDILNKNIFVSGTVCTAYILYIYFVHWATDWLDWGGSFKEISCVSHAGDGCLKTSWKWDVKGNMGTFSSYLLDHQKKQTQIWKSHTQMCQLIDWYDKSVYSQTCLERPPSMSRKSGLSRQVVVPEGSSLHGIQWQIELLRK